MTLMKFAPVLLGTLAAFSCLSHVQPAPSQQKASVTSMACSRMAPVSFQAAAKGKPLSVPPQAVPKPSIHIDLSPNDLAKAESLKCLADGICQAVINRPVSFDKTLPLGIPGVNAKLTLAYKQEADKTGKICLRKLKVGTSISPLPHCVGEIVTAKIDLGMSMSQSIDTKTDQAENKAEPYCKGQVSCSLPFLSVAMHADEKGLEIENTVTAKGLTDNVVLEKILPEKKVSTHVDFKDIPEKFRKFKETVQDVKEIMSPDFDWVDLINSCDPKDKN